jgi:nucleotide-binding universal stress UspA family protein
MAGYTTIVVGTDGSDSSLRAVDRAARIARDSVAKLVIACAFVPAKADAVAHDMDVLGPVDAYHVVGMAPADETVRTAIERAHAAGALDVESIVLPGRAAEVLCDVVRKVDADLVVVGNWGLNSLAGRLIGSVPLDVARHAPVDVLIVHTT